MVIVEDFDDPAVLGRIAQKLLDAIAQPFKIEEHDIYVTSSIGIARVSGRFGRSGGAPEARGRRDVPLKELGRNTYQFLDANLAEHRLRQHTLETALRAALDGRTRCGCTTSRWCASPTARSSAPRRCCAGTTPSTAACRRRCSFRSPRNRASSTRSANGCCDRRRSNASRGATRACR